MKKNPIIPLVFLLWASIATAQEAPWTSEEINEGQIGPVYTGVSLDRSPRAGEYDYLKSSGGGNLHVELTPLPSRFSLEGHVVNEKDYFGDMNYAYRDVVLFSFLARGVHHNLDHYSFGTDDPATSSLSFIDLNPNDQYAIENALRKGFVRFKMPDFPFHVYADATRIDRDGTMQQRFLRGYTGGLNRVSQTREIDWSATEVHAGVNSHLGPVEIDYNHGEKKFTAKGDKLLDDPYALMTVPHNLVPDLTSSSDTVKLHSSLTGRIVASGTLSDGSKKNEDSGATSKYRNTAGDLTLTPAAGLAVVLKYRHYNLSLDNPDTVTTSGVANTYAVRDSLSSTRDVMTGAIRYRLTARLTVKGEYSIETIERNAPVTTADSWEVAQRTTKTSEKLGITYRVMNVLSLRADYSAVQVTNPAYADDPDRINAAKATLSWTPVRRVIVLASYGGVREKRDDLTAPLAGGSRKTDRDQGLGSITVLVGKRSSVTASTLIYQNKAKETLTYRDAAGSFLLEDSVPYADKAQVYSLSATQAVGDSATLIVEASKSYSSGMFRTSGSVAEGAGIDTFSDLRVVENTYTAGLEIQHSTTISSELRYQQQHYDDKLNNAQDGRVSIVMATMAAKW